MAKVGVKYYLIINDEIIKIGLDTKRVFLDLANQTVPSFQVIFKKDDPSTILEIRVDPHHFDSRGKYKADEFVMQRATTAISNAFFSADPASNNRVVELRPRAYISVLTETQKILLKSRLNKDFGPNAWESLPAHMKLVTGSSHRPRRPKSTWTSSPGTPSGRCTTTFAAFTGLPRCWFT